MAGDDSVPQTRNISGLKVFKGTAYGPSEHLSVRRKRYRMMTQEEMEKYNEKVTQSKGFDVDGCTGSLSGRIVPLHCHSRAWKIAVAVARWVVALHYVQEGKRLSFRCLDKANVQPVSGTMYYLTFTAKDTTDKTMKIYRAKVWGKPGGGKLLLRSFEEYGIRTSPLQFQQGFPGDVLLAFTALVKKIKSENPSMKHAMARKAASKKWKLLSDSEKQSLISEQA